jgi:hypothetical protein
MDNTFTTRQPTQLLKIISYCVGSAGLTGMVAAPGIGCHRAVGSSAAGVDAAAGNPAGCLVAAVGRRPRRRHAGELAGSNSPRCHNSTGGDSWSVGLQAPPHPAAAMIHAAHHADACCRNLNADVQGILGFLRHGGPGGSLNLRTAVPKISKIAQNTIFSACKQGKGVIYVQNMANPLTSFLKLPA